MKTWRIMKYVGLKLLLQYEILLYTVGYYISVQTEGTGMLEWLARFSAISFFLPCNNSIDNTSENQLYIIYCMCMIFEFCDFCTGMAVIAGNEILGLQALSTAAIHSAIYICNWCGYKMCTYFWGVKLLLVVLCPHIYGFMTDICTQHRYTSTILPKPQEKQINM